MSRDGRIGRWSVRAIGLLAGAVLCAQVLFYFARTVDDLFISLRYAENLLAGHGPVYNPGERVEGVSSPLWLLLQTAGMAAGLDGVTATKLLSLVSLSGLFAVAVAFARRVLGVTPVASTLLVLLLACNSYLLSWSLLGLETPLYLALLLLWPLVLQRLGKKPKRPALVAAVAAGSALALVRPEALLFVAIGLLAAAARRGAGRRALVHVAAGVGSVLALFEIGRLVYYGSWVPQTYFAKQGGGWDWTRVEALVGQGAEPAETALLGAGLLAALWLAVFRRELVLLGYALGCAVFVASVQTDWMPNQRHLLPVWVVAALAFTAAGSALARLRSSVRWTASAVLLLGLWCAVEQLTIDSRFAPSDFATHGRGEHWVRRKEPETWRDAWLALRRQEPPHVAGMRVSGMGMIHQLFRVLEHAPDPESDAWYVGRDIGRVGYFSPVRILDTDGLFTPAAAGHDDHVPPEIAREALGRRPVAIEIYGAWSAAFGREPDLLRGYRIRAGSPRHPVVLTTRATPPPPEVVRERYERVSRQFPQWFFLATLYGESVGAAFEKRRRFMEQQLGGR